MKRRTVLALLTTLMLGVIGMSLSTLHQKQSAVQSGLTQTRNIEVSYGYPISWYGYEETIFTMENRTVTQWWFSTESFVLDAIGWFALSYCVVWGTIAIVKLASIPQKRRASRNLSVIDT